MGEIFVKKNNAFQRVVGEGITIITGGGGGGSGVTIASYAYRSDVDSDATIPYASSTSFPHDGTEGVWAYRNLSKYLDRVLTNTNSLGTGQQFNAETGKFTAPVAGVYRFDATAVIQLAQAAAPVDSVWFYMWLRKNPTNHNSIPSTSDARIGQLVKVYRDEDAAGASTAQIVNATETWQVELSANDTVVLCGGWNSAAGTTLLGASFSASYIGGASVTPASPVAVYARTGVNAILNSSSGTTGSTFNAAFFGNNNAVEDLDPSNCFDPQSCVFTAPVSGDYAIGFSAAVADLTNDNTAFGFEVWIQKTPAGTATLTPSNSAGENRLGEIFTDGASVGSGDSFARRCGSSNTWLVHLNVGDRIRWHGRAYPSGGQVTIQNFAWKAHLLTSMQTISEPSEVTYALPSYYWQPNGDASDTTPVLRTPRGVTPQSNLYEYRGEEIVTIKPGTYRVIFDVAFSIDDVNTGPLFLRAEPYLTNPSSVGYPNITGAFLPQEHIAYAQANGGSPQNINVILRYAKTGDAGHGRYIYLTGTAVGTCTFATEVTGKFGIVYFPQGGVHGLPVYSKLEGCKLTLRKLLS